MHLFCDWPADYADQFWAAYPRKVGKGAMGKALAKVRARGDVKFDIIVAGIERYKTYLAERSATRWRPEPCHASTWLNQERWKDEFGGDHHETTGNIAGGADRAAAAGFRLGPKPRHPLLERGPGDVPLLPSE